MEKFFKSEHFLAQGDEKMVFLHTKDDGTEIVISYYREHKKGGDREARGRFYLTKILHIIFPKNVPDIHFSSKDATITQKVIVGPEHKRLSELIKKDQRTPNEEREMMDLKDNIAKKIRKSSFFNDLVRLNIDIDPEPQNFGFNEGETNYVDSFEPWFINEKGELCRGYDVSEVTKAIEEISDSAYRERAVKYFERLESLFQQEEEAQKRTDTRIKNE